ncbi:MAG: hypothetical protein AAFX58_01360 [Pseudomonadota bacterium]
MSAAIGVSGDSPVAATAAPGETDADTLAELRRLAAQSETLLRDVSATARHEVALNLALLPALAKATLAEVICLAVGWIVTLVITGSLVFATTAQWTLALGAVAALHAVVTLGWMSRRRTLQSKRGFSRTARVLSELTT